MKELVLTRIKTGEVVTFYPRKMLPNRDVFNLSNNKLKSEFISSILFRGRLYNYTLPIISIRNFEFIVVVNLTDLILVRLLNLFSRTKIILWYGESNEFYSVPVKVKLKKFILQLADGYACYSQSSKKLVRKITTKRPSAIIKQRVGLTPNLTSTRRPFTKNKIDIIIISQMIARKDLGTVLNWITSFDHLERHYTINIVGGGKMLIDWKKSYEGNFGNIEIRFLGPKPHTDALKLLKESHLCLFHTKSDIWGYVTNEALAFGVPVLISNKATSSELIVNSLNGYRYDYQDYSHFKYIFETIDSLSENKFMEMARNCVKTYEEFECDQKISDFDILFEKMR